MENIHHQIAIIGGGTAGITIAARLLNADKNLDVAIIDPADNHYYQPAWTLVGAGTFRYKKTERPMASVIPRHAKWIKEKVEEIDPDNKTLVLGNGQNLTFDYLVACPGIQINIDGLPGLKEAMERKIVTSVYVNPKDTWETLQNFKGGTALFTQPATPIKCGGAPQKIMYLSDDYFRKSGVRANTNIVFATPGTVIFGTEPFKTTLMKIVDRKDIHLRFYHKLTGIDPENRLAYYQITKFADQPEKYEYNHKEVGIQSTGADTISIPFDLMHTAPPQSAPEFIQKSKLAWQEGPNKGWIEVDDHTLQHKRYPYIFALGDSAALPTAKTGAAIRKQAPVLVENLLSVMKSDDSQLIPGYDGYSSCPIVTGYGKMLLAEFKYGNERASDPLISKFVDTSKEQYSMWLLKKYGLPFMYWNLMLKGKA